jgi:hypothetical protein
MIAAGKMACGNSIARMEEAENHRRKSLHEKQFCAEVISLIPLVA